MNRNPAVATAVALAAMLVALPAAADYRYDRCVREARDISGYDGDAPKSVLGGTAKGGLGGAALGAAGGWVAGSDKSSSARRGAKLGVVVGAAKAASDNKKITEQRRTFERALDACLRR
jgi:hypothetical protein